MPKMKTDRYIVKDYISDEDKIKLGRTPNVRKLGVPFANGRLWLDDKLVKGAFYMEVVLLEPGSISTGEWVKPHTHDCDEIIGFVGTSIQDPRDLGGEVTLWLEGDRHVINETCLVYVPAGMSHCPLSIDRVSIPIVHWSVLTGGKYLWTDMPYPEGAQPE